MTWNIWKTCLIVSDLSPGDCAAWVQAWGTILAVGGAFAVGAYQASSQAKSSIRALDHERAQDRLRVAEAFCELSQSSLSAIGFIAGKVDTREKLHLLGDGGLPFDMPEIERLGSALDAIPLHELPAGFVKRALVLSSFVRQFRIKVSMALKQHRTMDAAHFDDFFNAIAEMRSGLAETTQALKADLETLRESINP